jgi:small subunit ribosomal protein S9
MAKKSKDLQYYEAVGRRKESVARVRLHIATASKPAMYKGEKVNVGDVMINMKPLAEYFGTEALKRNCLFPLRITNNADRFATTIVVKGGGTKGQMEAIILGISRALCKVDEELRPVLKENGLLTRDPRVKERRKVGTGGKARRQKQSPKR